MMKYSKKIPSLKEMKENIDERFHFFDLYFQKYPSFYFTRFLLKFKGISAEKVCAGWVISGLIGGVFYYFGNYWFSIIGLFFFQVGMILDCSDGDVARFQNKKTIRGPYLDLIGHTSVNSLILLGVGVYSYFNPVLGLNNSWFLLLGGISAVSLIGVNNLNLKIYEVLLDNNLSAKKEKVRLKTIKPKGFYNSIIHPFLRVGPGCALYPATIFGLLQYYIMLMSVVGTAVYIRRAFFNYKYLRENYDEA